MYKGNFFTTRQVSLEMPIVKFRNAYNHYFTTRLHKINKLKKEVGATGTKNDEKSVKFRQEANVKMQKLSNRIKEIHEHLLEFEAPELQEKIKERDAIIVVITGKEKEFEAIMVDLGADDVILVRANNEKRNELIEMTESLKENTDEASLKIVAENTEKINAFISENEAIIKKFDAYKFKILVDLETELVTLADEASNILIDINEFHNTFNTTEKEVKNPPEEWNEETLNAAYKYVKMSWAERKILYKNCTKIFL